MRWKTKIERKPYHGEQRVLAKFAWLPIKDEDRKGS